MNSLFSKIIKDMSTCIDGESYDFGKIFGAVIILVFLGISIYAYVITRQVFDPMNYGAGAGSLFGGIGIHLFMKKDTEPKGEK
jgi:hypothetical protein